MSLSKAGEYWWSAALEGEEHIDIDRINKERSMATVDDEEHAVLDRLTFDYHQKLQGRPQSHELVRPRAWGAGRWGAGQKPTPAGLGHPPGPGSAAPPARWPLPAGDSDLALDGELSRGAEVRWSSRVCAVCAPRVSSALGASEQEEVLPSHFQPPGRGTGSLARDRGIGREVCSGRRGPHLAAPRKGLAGWVQLPLVCGAAPQDPRHCPRPGSY